MYAVMSVSGLISNVCRIVKLTSPKLNYVYIVGIVMLLFGVVLFPVPSRDQDLVVILCIVSAQLNAV